jgi:hypothetical protein
MFGIYLDEVFELHATESILRGSYTVNLTPFFILFYTFFLIEGLYTFLIRLCRVSDLFSISYLFYGIIGLCPILLTLTQRCPPFFLKINSAASPIHLALTLWCLIFCLDSAASWLCAVLQTLDSGLSLTFKSQTSLSLNFSRFIGEFFWIFKLLYLTLLHLPPLMLIMWNKSCTVGTGISGSSLNLKSFKYQISIKAKNKISR